MTDVPVGSPTRKRRLRSLLGGACTVVLTLATLMLPGTAHAAVTSNETGIHGGYFYSFWTDSPGTAAMHLGHAGNYQVTWNNTWNFIAGKGWNPGGDHSITYSASFNPVGNAFLGVYGWTRSPLVEYFIVDSWGTWRPPGSGFLGTVTTDGGVYDIYRTQRVGGINPYQQVWSVRQTKRVGGTITVSNHFDAWTALGLRLGTHDFQIVAVEGYQSSGTANVTIWGTPPYPDASAGSTAVR